MSCGLISLDGNVVPLKKIECSADITGDFGLYTLVQHYYNDYDTALNVRYLFPIPSGGAVIELSAVIGNKTLKSEIMDKHCAKKLINDKQNSIMLTRHKSGALEAFIGALAPKSKILIKIKYLCNSVIDENSVRLIIPTVIAPRYVSYGQQLALESVLGEAKYKVSLDMTYRGKDISDVKSVSHDINVEIDSYGARVSLAQESCTDRDIVIDIMFEGKNRPMMFYYNDTACYSFTPKIDIYRRVPREYTFILDVSESMEGEKLRQAKNALLVCLRGLDKRDSFNIIAFQTTYYTFSEAPVEFGEESLQNAKKWINSLSAQGGTELMRPIIFSCERENTTVLLFTDGQISNYEDILSYVQNHKNITFYTFGIDSAVNVEFLSQLAAAGGGIAKFITPTERIDEAIIRTFNKITVSAIKNAVVTFDTPGIAMNITPKVIKQIHAGQKVTIAAKFSGAPPRNLTVSGEFAGVKCVMQVQFEHPANAGKELLYYYAKGQIDALTAQLTGEEIRDGLIRKQIAKISVENGILSDETAFVLSYSDEGKQKVIDIVVPAMLPAYWKTPAISFREAPKKKTKTDEYFKIIKSQRANGSFFKAKVNTVEHTANILHYFCTECDKADLFIWQLRKSASFLINSIQESNNAVIPEIVLDALEVWNRKFHANNDEISQKVAALTFMYGKNSIKF